MTRLRAVTLPSGDGTEPVWSPADALLICIGGAPRTNGAAGIELPACQLPTGSSPCTSLSASSSIMLRSYSSIVSIVA